MSDIIKFPDQSDELKFTAYTIGDDGYFGVVTKSGEIEISQLNKNEFVVATPFGSNVHNREQLAELIWLAAILLDSEERFRPDVELIGCDY